jgi:hypothetical protein
VLPEGVRPDSYFLQHHNAAKLGWVPFDECPFLQTKLSIYTRRRLIHEAVGGMVFLIVGLGRPKRYYLWECFRVEGVESEDGHFCAWGTGWQLVPPQRLAGDDFEQFRRACGYFIGFRAIDRLPYHRTLVELANRFRRNEVNGDADRFCGELIDCLPDSGDVWFFRGWVRERLGDHAGALADLERAIALGGEFRGEAEKCVRLLRGAAPESSTGFSNPVYPDRSGRPPL